MLRLASHLWVSRHGVHYFRLRVPSILRAICGGRHELRISLRTRDPKTAKFAAAQLWVLCHEVFQSKPLGGPILRNCQGGIMDRDGTARRALMEALQRWRRPDTLPAESRSAAPDRMAP